MLPEELDIIEQEEILELNKITESFYTLNRYVVFFCLLTNGPSIFVAIITLIRGRPEEFSTGIQHSLKFITWVLIPLFVVIFQKSLELKLKKYSDRLSVNLIIFTVSILLWIYFFYFYEYAL